MSDKSRINTITVNTANDFLDLLSKRHERWRDDKSRRNYWVYRGQWEPAHLVLSPASLRDNLGLSDARVKERLLREVLPNGGEIESISKYLAEEYLTKKITLFNKVIRAFTSDESVRLKEIIKQSMMELLLIKEFIE